MAAAAKAEFRNAVPMMTGDVYENPLAAGVLRRAFRRIRGVDDWNARNIAGGEA